ncbi:MAG: response regulator [Proteobacteria bacterium]|nr:response regulator [Pseudomonadota bacterium]
MPRILIVDDEPHIRLLLEQTMEELEDEGVELLTASNGIDALSIIKEKKPELIFIDVMMPGMSGFEVCNKVKNELGMKELYMIMLTAKGQEVDREQGIKSGADIYMTKPFNPDDVLKKAREVLGLV